MTYNMFEPNTSTHGCIWKEIEIEEEDFNRSNSSDALLSPIAIAVRKLIRATGDVLATSKQVLYYNCRFDRTDINIVLGKGRLLTYKFSEEVAKEIRDYETTGVVPKLSLLLPIPKILLDENTS